VTKANTHLTPNRIVFGITITATNRIRRYCAIAKHTSHWIQCNIQKRVNPMMCIPYTEEKTDS